MKKTLEQIKLEIAQENGYPTWRSLIAVQSANMMLDQIESYYDDATSRFVYQSSKPLPIVMVGCDTVGKSALIDRLHTMQIATLDQGTTLTTREDIDTSPSMITVMERIQFEQVFKTPLEFDRPRSKYHK